MSIFDERDASGRLLSDEELERIEAALKSLMLERHKGQVDHRGAPYPEHPERVANILDPDHHRPGLRARAYGHDLLEDTRTTQQELLDVGATPEMVADILGLTKRPGQPHMAYRQEVYGSIKRMLVKMADMTDAFDPNRPLPDGMSDGFLSRRRRNWEFYKELEMRLDEAGRGANLHDTLEMAAIMSRFAITTQPPAAGPETKA